MLNSLRSWHSSIVSVPLNLVVRPSGQDLHVPCRPNSSLYVPTGQGTHLPFVEVPGGHSKVVEN